MSIGLAVLLSLGLAIAIALLVGHFWTDPEIKADVDEVWGSRAGRPEAPGLRQAVYDRAIARAAAGGEAFGGGRFLLHIFTLVAPFILLPFLLVPGPSPFFPDGTYQRCEIPAPDSSDEFACHYIWEDEYLPFKGNDYIEHDDGSATWFVSRKRGG